MFLLPEKISITYGVTVCNEHLELENLLNFLVEHAGKNDEIIILSDESGVTKEVLQVIERFEKSIKHISYPLNNNFSAFKNNLIQYATGDYLFQIDADELPNINLIKNLKRYLFFHFIYDCFAIPRVNYVTGLTQDHIEEWKWNCKIDEHGRINYPDYQMRLFKLNKKIKWVNPIHEQLKGYLIRKKMPYKSNENFCLYHVKDVEKQRKQSLFYKSLGEK